MSTPCLAQFDFGDWIETAIVAVIILGSLVANAVKAWTERKGEKSDEGIPRPKPKGPPELRPQRPDLPTAKPMPSPQGRGGSSEYEAERTRPARPPRRPTRTHTAPSPAGSAEWAAAADPNRKVGRTLTSPRSTEGAGRQRRETIDVSAPPGPAGTAGPRRAEPAGSPMGPPPEPIAKYERKKADQIKSVIAESGGVDVDPIHEEELNILVEDAEIGAGAGGGPRINLASMRQGVILSEILGRPVGLRELQ